MSIQTENSLQIIMENQLKCVLLLSLKELALRRVAALLWRGSDILVAIAQFDFPILIENDTRLGKIFQELKDNLRDEMLKIEIPKSLMKPMIDILRSMSFDIKRWAKSHHDYFFDSCDRYNYSDYFRQPWRHYIQPHLPKLCWTAAGTIDDRKTAEELLRYDALPLVELSYELACFHCLEDYIPHFWEKLPEERQKVYYNYKGNEPRLQSCWPHILKGDLSKLDYLFSTSDRNPFTLYQYIFEYAAENGNRTATEYFFRKLTFEERDDSLMRSAHAVLTKIQDINPFDYLDNGRRENRCSVFCYLLSVMSPVQQMEILESRPFDVLLSFLIWPCQDLFLENLSLIWRFLPPSSYGILLLNIVHWYSDYVSKSYRELLIQSPLEFKKFFVNQEHKYYFCAVGFLDLVFVSNDLETLGVIFRNLNAVGRVKLVFQHEILKRFYRYGCLEFGWPVVEVCLREAMLSNEDKKILKKALMAYLKSKGEIDWENRNLKRFFEFLDNSDEGKKAQKRKLEL